MKAKTQSATGREVTAKDIEHQAGLIWRQIVRLQRARLAWDDDEVVRASNTLWRYIDRAHTPALSQACRNAIDIDFRMAAESYGAETYVIVAYETETEWKAKCKVKGEKKPIDRALVARPAVTTTHA